MSAKIHPTAIVSPSAELGNDVEVGPYCTIGPDVKVGDGTRFISHVVVDGVTKDFEPNSRIIGMPARPFDEQMKILAMQNKALREREKGKKKS